MDAPSRVGEEPTDFAPRDVEAFMEQRQKQVVGYATVAFQGFTRRG
jgi:hypothetical protein